MHFMDSYKSLEKLCSEQYGEQHGISSYIDDMLNHPDGVHYVPGWQEDLKQLKHYRWVRNQIVHEPGYTEADLCEPGDALWLEDFRSRIMMTKDPLAMYRKAKKGQNATKKQNAYHKASTNYDDFPPSDIPSRHDGCMIGILCLFLVGVIVAVVAKYLL